MKITVTASGENLGEAFVEWSIGVSSAGIEIGIESVASVVGGVFCWDDIFWSARFDEEDVGAAAY